VASRPDRRLAHACELSTRHHRRRDERRFPSPPHPVGGACDRRGRRKPFPAHRFLGSGTPCSRWRRAGRCPSSISQTARRIPRRGEWPAGPSCSWNIKARGMARAPRDHEPDDGDGLGRGLALGSSGWHRPGLVGGVGVDAVPVRDWSRPRVFCRRRRPIRDPGGCGPRDGRTSIWSMHTRAVARGRFLPMRISISSEPGTDSGGNRLPRSSPSVTCCVVTPLFGGFTPFTASSRSSSRKVRVREPGDFPIDIASRSRRIAVGTRRAPAGLSRGSRPNAVYGSVGRSVRLQLVLPLGFVDSATSARWGSSWRSTRASAHVGP